VPVPFPPVDGEFRARQIAIAPDGTAYRVPSGFHERLRQAVDPDRERRDPKVALTLAGWVCLQTSGMTDRINVDAPDELTDATPIRRFARAHDAGSVAIARHPSGEVIRSTNPKTFRFEDT
jgi:hypothetical protein